MFQRRPQKEWRKDRRDYIPVGKREKTKNGNWKNLEQKQKELRT